MNIWRKFSLFALAALFAVTLSSCKTYNGFRQLVTDSNAAHPFGAGEYFKFAAGDGKVSLMRRVDESSYVPVNADGVENVDMIFRFQLLGDDGYLKNYRKYIVEYRFEAELDGSDLFAARMYGYNGKQMSTYSLMLIDDAGIVRVLSSDHDVVDLQEELPVSTLDDLKKRFRRFADAVRDKNGHVPLQLVYSGVSAISADQFRQEQVAAREGSERAQRAAAEKARADAEAQAAILEEKSRREYLIKRQKELAAKTKPEETGETTAQCRARVRRDHYHCEHVGTDQYFASKVERYSCRGPSKGKCPRSDRLFHGYFCDPETGIYDGGLFKMIDKVCG